mgnify:CR=1 FL=1
MECTVINFISRKELYYGRQEMSWLDWVIYDVPEDKIDMIRTCESSKIQEVIDLICKTSKRIWDIHK